MKAKKEGVPITRRVELPETEWKWLCGWFDALFRSIGTDELTGDMLRMSATVRTIKSAERIEPSEDSDKKGTA